MKYVNELMKCIVSAIAIFIFLSQASLPAMAREGVMMQYFHWYFPTGGILWDEVSTRADQLAAAGITAKKNLKTSISKAYLLLFQSDSNPISI